jgi:hypothetical protein
VTEPTNFAGARPDAAEMRARVEAQLAALKQGRPLEG